MNETRSVRIEAGGSGLAARFSAMASPCEVLVDGADAAELQHLGQLAAAEVWRIERHWSRYLPGNIVDRINRAQGAALTVDAETARFLDYAQQLFELSEGLFDVTSGVLRRAWRFDGSDRLPDPAQIEALLPLVGWQKLHWRSPQLQMPAGMEIDFGGIGKEYAVDRACALLAAQTSRAVLVNCGGDLAASGPRQDAEDWLVGIDSGLGSNGTVIRLRQGGVATSGDAHRFLLKDGRRYPHILNPKTGWPVLHGPRSVTVAGKSCTEAGVLSTLAMLQGDQAEHFLQQCAGDFQVIW